MKSLRRKIKHLYATAVGIKCIFIIKVFDLRVKDPKFKNITWDQTSNFELKILTTLTPSNINYIVFCYLVSKLTFRP